VIASWIAAHYISWKAPRLLQHAQKAVSLPLRLALINRLHPRNRYTKEQISPHFWSNGKPPDREGWKHLERDNFRDYRLKIGGLVENPVELAALSNSRQLKTNHAHTYDRRELEDAQEPIRNHVFFRDLSAAGRTH
jgi:methionine sulfoxide reductase catalytic subunit